MLQRRGRVTYRTLRLQFQLDEEQLEVLKEALIDAERLAVDEEGRVLVWIGGTETPVASVSPPSPARTLACHARGGPASDGASACRSLTPEAERRQLTVMFCDLVDSTKLSSQLDPENPGSRPCLSIGLY